MDSEIPVSDEITKNKISRRDFLKLSGLFASVLAIPREIMRIKKEKPIILETETARYYPFFGRHDKPVNIPTELSKCPEQPSIHFCEIIALNAQDFQNTPPRNLLTTSIVGEFDEPLGRLTNDDTLGYLYQNNISLAYEGSYLDKKYFTSFDPFQMAAGAAVISADIGVAINDINKFAHHTPLNKTDLLINLAPLLATLWMVSPKTLPRMNSIIPYDALPPNTNTNDIKTAMKNVSDLTSNQNPDNMQVFFRNLLIARKLQTLAAFGNPGEQYKKPTISFLLGSEHAGVNDLLVLGNEVTLAGFNAYSTDVLRDIVDSNGGIDAFCTTLIIPVKGNIESEAEIKRKVFDFKLKTYLENRFKVEENQ